MNEVDRIEIKLLSHQLTRMRGMQYAYNRKFFTLLLITAVAIAAGFTAGTATAWLLLAFGLVTAGVTASFFLHFCDFARTHARAIEQRINALLGRPVLLASRIEAEYFYPHEATKISGYTPERPDTFFSMFTLHFTVLWAAAIAAAWWNLLSTLGALRCLLPLAVFLVWSSANVAFLFRWFNGDAERRVAKTLRAAYAGTQDERPAPAASVD
jgi:membrane protein implicated in regulation of membrane protease activity